MKKVWAAFKQFTAAIWSDAMLAACLFVPILMGLVLRFGVPALEGALAGSTGSPHALMPFYALFDLFLSLMTPLMLVFSGIMVILEELDDGTARYLMITPLGKSGYLLSRLGMFGILSIGYNIAISAIFTLSGLPLAQNVLLALCNLPVSLSVAMIVIAFAKNKVEGMALVKLSGFFFLGYLAAWFLQKPTAYLAGVLPSYWLALMVRENALLWAVPALLVSLVWIALLYKRFRRRVMA